MKKLYILLIALFTLNVANAQGWQSQNPSPQGNQLNCIKFVDANIGYAVGYWGTILKTTNGGALWTSQSSGTAKWLYSVYFTDANTGYTVGQNGTILKTTDGGTLWTTQTSGTLNGLCSVYFTDAKAGYAVGFSGTILKTNNGGGYPFAVDDLSTNSTHLKIYPNPCIDKIAIDASEKSIPSNLSILNLKGQELLKQTVNKTSTQIDISTLQSGVYLVRLTNDRKVAVGKIIKQ